MGSNRVPVEASARQNESKSNCVVFRGETAFLSLFKANTRSIGDSPWGHHFTSERVPLRVPVTVHLAAIANKPGRSFGHSLGW